MIKAFLDLSAATQFMILAVVYCGWAALLHAITARWATKAFFVRFRGVPSPFLGAIGILFALLAGFLANEVGNRRHAALEAVTTEAESLYTLHAVTLATPADLSTVRDAIRAVLHSDLHEEWPRMMARELSPATDIAYRMLFREIAMPSVATAIGTAVQSTLFETALRASHARSQRLTVASDRGDDAKWTCALLLALLTQLTVALVLLLDRPEPQGVALAMFTVASIIALSLIAFQEEPFSGPLRILPSPLEQVQRVIGT